MENATFVPSIPASPSLSALPPLPPTALPAALPPLPPTGTRTAQTVEGGRGSVHSGATQQRDKRGQGFTLNEKENLLDIVEQFLPVSHWDWEAVANTHGSQYTPLINKLVTLVIASFKGWQALRRKQGKLGPIHQFSKPKQSAKNCWI